MKEVNPDIVYVANFPAFFIKFAKQADELGLKPKAMHCSTCSAGSVGKGLGLSPSTSRASSIGTTA